MQAGLVAVDVLHELLDAAFRVEGLGLLGAFVRADDDQALVQVGQLFEALLQDVEGIDRGLENLFIRHEVDGRAMPFGITDGFHLGDGDAALVALAPALAVAADSDFEPARKSVHAGNAHAVQTAGNLVGVIVELAAGMELGHDHLNGRDAQFGMDIDRDAAAIVAHRDGIIDMDDNFHPVAEAGHSFVDGVVHHFVHEMVQAASVGTADIHGRTLANSGKAFKHGDRTGIVFFRCGAEILLAHGNS